MRTSLKMAVIFLISTFFLSCGVKPSPSIIPPPPTKVESVVPSLKTVSKGIDDSIIENVKLSNKIEEQKNSVSEQKIAILDAISQAEKIKEKSLANQAISEVEAINLITQLKNVQSRNLFLETQNSELSTIKNRQDQLLQDVKNKSSETLQKLLAKEGETDNLRTQNDFLGKNLVMKNSELQSLQSNLEKEKVKSARAEVYRKWILGLVSAFVLWTVIKNVLMAYSPIKFRI